MKDNKKSILFLIIGILIGLIIGFTTSNVITKDSSKTDTKEEQKNEETEKQEEENQVIAIDEKVLKIGVKLIDDEDIYSFIHSSSNLAGWQSDNFAGAMFNETISDEYKLFYTLSRAFVSIYNQEGSYSGELVSIKKSTIEQLAKQIFAEFKFPENITKGAWYAGTHDVACDDTKCVFISDTFGILGPAQPEYEGPITKGDNNKYIIKPIFIDYENDTYANDETITDIILKDRHDGKVIKTLKQQKLSTLESEEDPRNPYYNSLSKYYTNIPTYTYEFNEENVLLSVKKS